MINHTTPSFRGFIAIGGNRVINTEHITYAKQFASGPTSDWIKVNTLDEKTIDLRGCKFNDFVSLLNKSLQNPDEVVSLND